RNRVRRVVFLRRPLVVRNIETDRVMQKVFHDVLRFRAGPIHTWHLIGRFGPKVSRIKRVGMAIDSMVHLVFGVRRAQRAGKKGWSAWVAGREEQWRGIAYSDVITAAGFGIFVLSDFPPTQRFGLVVVAGTIIDILANLFVLPLLGGAQWKNATRIEDRMAA